MNGRLISVSIICESSILAFSAASFSRCSAILSLLRSILFFCLSLCVVEIRRDLNYGLGDFFAEKILCGSLQLAEDHRGNLRRAVGFARNLYARILMWSRDYLVGHTAGLFANFIKATAHEPFDRIHRILGIRYCLPLSH